MVGTAVVLSGRTKLLLYVAIGIFVLAIAFAIYRVITRQKPPKAKKPDKNNWSPTPLADELVKAYVGWSNSPLAPWTNPNRRDFALNKLYSLDDEQTVQVYNEFNKKAYAEGHNMTLTQTIKDGSTWFVDDTLNSEVIGKLTRLNLN